MLVELNRKKKKHTRAQDASVSRALLLVAPHSPPAAPATVATHAPVWGVMVVVVIQVTWQAGG